MKLHRHIAILYAVAWLYSWGLLGCAHEGSTGLNDRVVVAAPAEVIEPYQPPVVRDLSPVWVAHTRLLEAELDMKLAHVGRGDLAVARLCYRQRHCELVAAILRAIPLGVPVLECDEPCDD